MNFDTKSDKIFCVFNYIILTVVTIAIVYPVFFVLVASISDPTYVNLGQTLLFPKGLNLEGYKTIMQYPEVWSGYLNSIIYTVVGTTINLIVVLPAAFALSRKELYGRSKLMMLFTLTMYFSGGTVPLYMLVRDLHLMNTMWALVLPGALNVYNLIVCRSFFVSNVPDELFEAVKMDGASYTRFFFSIVLPLSKTIIAVMVLFHALAHWNSYLNALYYIKDKSKFPLQLILRNLTAQLDITQAENMDVQAAASAQKLKESVKYAIIIVASVPLLALYPFVQKYFMKGVMIGSVKG